MSILDKLKEKAKGTADAAKNIEEAIDMMGFGGGGESRSNVDVIVEDNKIKILTKGGD